METVSGWLFLNLERTRLVFVADELEVQKEAFNWNLLLHGDCLERFLEKYEARPTSEGPLQGYRIDVPLSAVKQCLRDCAGHHEQAQKQEPEHTLGDVFDHR
jgi:hypothetical protein